MIFFTKSQLKKIELPFPMNDFSPIQTTTIKPTKVRTRKATTITTQKTPLAKDQHHNKARSERREHTSRKSSKNSKIWHIFVMVTVALVILIPIILIVRKWRKDKKSRYTLLAQPEDQLLSDSDSESPDWLSHVHRSGKVPNHMW